MESGDERNGRALGQPKAINMPHMGRVSSVLMTVNLPLILLGDTELNDGIKITSSHGKLERGCSSRLEKKGGQGRSGDFEGQAKARVEVPESRDAVQNASHVRTTL